MVRLMGLNGVSSSSLEEGGSGGCGAVFGLDGGPGIGLSTRRCPLCVAVLHLG